MITIQVFWFNWFWFFNLVQPPTYLIKLSTSFEEFNGSFVNIITFYIKSFFSLSKGEFIAWKSIGIHTGASKILRRRTWAREYLGHSKAFPTIMTGLFSNGCTSKERAIPRTQTWRLQKSYGYAQSWNNNPVCWLILLYRDAIGNFRPIFHLS